jgi:Fic family protein
LVDLTRAESQISGSPKSGMLIGESAVPASEVTKELIQLISAVNRLGTGSSLREIAHIYQDFISIHPFADGNGRTGRVLLDYCLLKSGFPPLPHVEQTRDTLFKTTEEIESDFRSYYQRN